MGVAMCEQPLKMMAATVSPSFTCPRPCLGIAPGVAARRSVRISIMPMYSRGAGEQLSASTQHCKHHAAAAAVPWQKTVLRLPGIGLGRALTKIQKLRTIVREVGFAA